MTATQPLQAHQVSICSTIAKLSVNLDATDNVNLLFPKLNQFNQFVTEQEQNCFLLASTYNPTSILDHGVNFSSGTVNSFFGHFDLDGNKHLVFSDTELLSEQRPIYIPVSLLLQEYDLAELIVKTLNAKHFNSRWLLNSNSPANMVGARHKLIPSNINVILYGSTYELIHFSGQWPTIDLATHSVIHEADLVFKPTAENLSALCTLINNLFKYIPNKAQLNALVWALSRLAEDQHWLIIDIDYLTRLHQLLNKDYVKSDVEHAVKTLTGYYSHAKQFNYDQIQRGIVNVEFSGEKIGQINGLTVVETDHAEFGEPSRITANVFLGDGDIGDIERKSDLGGNIHAKAMMILSSFVSRTFAHNAPMPVSSNIVFEQSYHEVDGDSASIAELYALLSALAEVPIKQNVAITGAMDQLGSVQAVGGVDLKIEAFYELSKLVSPDSTPTVIIPKTNVPHLNLNSDVVKAIDDGQLIIVPISHVDQAAKLLTGLVAESEDGNSLFEKVRLSLDKFEEDTESHPTFKQKLARFLKLYSN
ncbi:hypothetical protein HR060_10790 [Catenovulum sp. SM1970]|uniref:S16 family serine protease n=1 Tax=Marinifaba aquimaris TaxID=2741323 RepID=UPI00157226E9|nr:S16 family serine protease [Marinifaba aquimaris]NTS77351.1 hypothetical protein [Marinifaba aquimaris]